MEKYLKMLIRPLLLICVSNSDCCWAYYQKWSARLMFLFVINTWVHLKLPLYDCYAAWPLNLPWSFLNLCSFFVSSILRYNVKHLGAYHFSLHLTDFWWGMKMCLNSSKAWIDPISPSHGFMDTLLTGQNRACIYPGVCVKIWDSLLATWDGLWIQAGDHVAVFLSEICSSSWECILYFLLSFSYIYGCIEHQNGETYCCWQHTVLLFMKVKLGPNIVWICSFSIRTEINELGRSLYNFSWIG